MSIIPVTSCFRCGACCAAFRVVLPLHELDNAPGGYVPSAMTLKVDISQMAMKGTDLRTPRCIALMGKIGINTSCSIYDRRPSACRNFFVSWENGVPNDMCDRARARYGLIPFSLW